MTLVTLIRHGETDWNAAHRLQGGTDVPLNERGREQALEAAGRLSIDAPVYLASSTLDRARETAAIIGGVHGWGSPIQYSELRERSFGEAEGMDFAGFVARYGAWDSAVVPGGESWDQVADRALAALRDLAADAVLAMRGTEPHVVAVAHGGVISALVRRLSTGSDAGEIVRVANGESRTFSVTDDDVSIHESIAVTGV